MTPFFKIIAFKKHSDVHFNLRVLFFFSEERRGAADAEVEYCVLFELKKSGDFPASSPAVWLLVCAGWESGDLQEQFGIAYYLTKTQTAPVLSSQSLTVKDLLLSNLGHTVRTIPS